ncbi:MAG: hypothetical protein ACR2LK_04265 [Solirubrobacteraceae bacterium]
MATTTTPDTGELRLALDDILVGDNVRDIDQEHVENLARSAGELYGRVLVVFAAQHSATQLLLPTASAAARCSRARTRTSAQAFERALAAEARAYGARVEELERRRDATAARTRSDDHEADEDVEARG